METKTNIKNNELLNDFSAKLLEGQIQLATTRGYLSDQEKKQQDSIGCTVKSNNSFLNIVADGLGCSENGEFASRYIVEKLLEWYGNTSEHKLNDTKKIAKELRREIRRINRQIFLKSKGTAQTTFALSLTNPYNTIIMNIGDSTIYTYADDKLQLLTFIKFYLMNGSYEQIRRDILNFLMGAIIGDYPLPKIYTRILDNDGQRLIISTDGVTDLIDEERFTNYFINKTDAKKIVKDALTNPDVVGKDEDNISAITVDLPKSSGKVKKLK